MADTVKDEKFTTAEDILNALSSTDKRWMPNPRVWAFRGQADAAWKLVPSILRGERWRDYLNDGEKSDLERSDFLRKMLMTVGEVGTVFEFFNAADRAGLALPEDMQDIRNSRQLARMVQAGHNEPSKWPPTRLLSIVGMAQHYGVPTRVLDWSWRPRVGAYFAAKDSCTATKHDSDCLAIWALNTKFITLGWMGGILGNAEQRVQLVTAPQATNPNLSAQAGIFTVDRDATDETCFSDKINQRHAECQKEGNTLAADISTPLCRLMLPHAEAPKLLRLLAYDHVSAATIYPGYWGVVTSLKERKLWDADRGR